MPRKAAKAKAQPTTPEASELDTTSPEHSPLGASSAERWMNCPGSQGLISQLELPDSDEEDWRAEGVALHEAAAHCLNNGLEAWEIAGQEFHGITMNTDMATAVDLYVEHCRPLAEATQTYGVEYRVSSPIHPLFYGTADFWAIAKTSDDRNALYVRDLKGGVGIVVDAYENPQLMYYAFGVIDTLERTRNYTFNDPMIVDLGIVQPRAFHPDGPIRAWQTTVGEIKEWVHSVLRPAMANAEIDGTLTPGEWCRFCPAKLVCPMLQGLFEALCKVDPTHVVNWSDASLDRSFALVASARFAQRAIEEEVFKRANSGATFISGKLVNKKANRVIPATVVIERDGAKETVPAKEEAVRRLGKDALSKPELLTPPALEKLGPRGKEFVREFAFTPFTGLTIAPRTDPREEVKPTPTSEMFKEALDAIAAGE